jgi:hypothetical protein
MGLKPEFVAVLLSKLQRNNIIHKCYKSVTTLIDMDENYGREGFPKLSYGVTNLFRLHKIVPMKYWNQFTWSQVSTDKDNKIFINFTFSFVNLCALRCRSKNGLQSNWLSTHTVDITTVSKPHLDKKKTSKPEGHVRELFWEVYLLLQELLVSVCCGWSGDLLGFKATSKTKTGALLLLFLDMGSVFSNVSVHKKRFTSWLHQDILCDLLNRFRE